MRDGTPKGERIISIGVPSAMYGISSSGKTVEITPLLPWRPESLSPTEIFLIWATSITIFLMMPASRVWPKSREKILTPIMRPRLPCSMRKEVSLTSRAFSANMERSNLSSGVSSVSPLGVILPTKISFSRTSAPIRTMPSSSKSLSFNSPTFGMSRVVISGPSLVSRTVQINSSTYTEVNLLFFTKRSEIIIASS